MLYICMGSLSSTRILTEFVVRLRAFGVDQPLFKNRTQFAGVLVTQLEIFEATDRCLTEYRAVRSRQRVAYVIT